MIENVNDINRVLLGIADLTESTERVLEEALIAHLEQTVVAGRNPPFGDVVKFARRMSLIEQRSGGVSITAFGDTVLGLNPKKFYELQEEQVAIIVKKCYLDGCNEKETRTILQKLDQDSEGKRLVWSEVDSEPFGDLEWVARHLEQFGVLRRTEVGYEVHSNYLPIVSDAIDMSKGLCTEEQLMESLAEKKVVGDLAEEYVLTYEQERLHARGCKAEAECVRRISKTRVSAGFDIESFNGKTSRLQCDRFIEVKGSGKDSVRFIWSENEQQKAAKLGDRYWIYFVGGIRRKERKIGRKPVMLQNPVKLFAEEAKFQRKPYGMLVEAKFAGPALDPAHIVSKR